jgi:hypothetical protein
MNRWLNRRFWKRGEEAESVMKRMKWKPKPYSYIYPFFLRIFIYPFFMDKLFLVYFIFYFVYFFLRTKNEKLTTPFDLKIFFFFGFYYVSFLYGQAFLVIFILFYFYSFFLRTKMKNLSLFYFFFVAGEVWKITSTVFWFRKLFFIL